jgi:4-amino-4-deoxy-L-arabinose transferase-like glycosyltransferase
MSMTRVTRDDRAPDGVEQGLCPVPAQRRTSWSRDALRVVARGDVLMMAALLVVAELVRLPYLWAIPRFTDESNEALRALMIAQGRWLPLTNVDPYIGPLWNYVLAGVFLVTGPSLYVPRAVVALFGILTLVPTYLLGRGIGGPGVGVLAAAFLALSPAHVVVNSHVGWSNCITPLLTTLALWLTHRAVTRAGPSGLAWAGIAWGLALQTHPVGFLFLPGVALYVVLARPRWLRSAWPWAATGLALAACSPLLIANLDSGFGGLRAGLQVQEQYAAGEPLSLVSYGRRLVEMVWLLSDSMSGVLSEFAALRGPWVEPLGLAFLTATALGLGYTTRRGDRLLVVAMVAYLALLPIVNARFGPVVPKARYVAPVLPLCFIGMSVLVVGLYRRAERLRAARARVADGVSDGVRVRARRWPAYAPWLSRPGSSSASWRCWCPQS